MDQKLILNIFTFIILIALFYFMLIRPNKKKEKEITLMRSNIKAGDEVITIGGLCGKVVRVKDDSFVLQVGASNTKFEMMKWGISKVISSSESKAMKKEEVKKPKPKNIKKLYNEEKNEVVNSETIVEEDITEIK